MTLPRVEIHRFVALTGASRNPCREERWGCAMEPPGTGGLTHQQLIGAGPQVLGAGLNSSENISRRSAAARFEASAGVVQKLRVGRTQTAFTLDHRKRDDDLRRRQGQQSMSQRIQRGITASKLLSRSAIIRSQGHDRNKVFCAVRSFCRKVGTPSDRSCSQVLVQDTPCRAPCRMMTTLPCASQRHFDFTRIVKGSI